MLVGNRISLYEILMVRTGLRKKINFLVFLAFLVNAIAPSIALAAVSSDPLRGGDTAGLAGSSDDRILICTPEGIKWVSRADLQKTSSTSGSETGLRCALCILPTFGTTVGNVSLASDFTVEPVVTEIGHFVRAPDIRCKNIFHTCGAFSRAPPHSL